MEYLLEFLINNFEHFTYAGIFLFLLLCGFGFPLPEDIILFAAGYIVYKGDITFLKTVVVSMIGVLVGDIFIFYIGRVLGNKMSDHKILGKILHIDRKNKVKKYFHKYGSVTIFFGRFMAGLRAPIYFIAGTSHMPFLKFLLLDFLAALISVPTFIYLAYYFGDQLDLLLGWVKNAKSLVALILITGALIIGLYLRFGKRKINTSSTS